MMRCFGILWMIGCCLSPYGWAQTHRMVWFGDSLSVNFHFDSYPNMIKFLWSQDDPTGMVADQSDPALTSVFEWLKKENPDFTLTNYAHAGASIVTYQNWAQQNLLQLKPLETQINMFMNQLDQPVDSLVLWIGHNDINRVVAYENCQIENEADKALICEEVRLVREKYFFEINRLIKHLQKHQPMHPAKIFIVGLVHLDTFLSLHQEAFFEHQQNKKINQKSRFLYIKRARKNTPFIKSQYRDQALLFGQSLNEDIQSWVAQRNSDNLGEIELNYAGKVSIWPMDKLEYLSVDGFHPGTIGLESLSRIIVQDLLTQGLFD